MATSVGRQFLDNVNTRLSTVLGSTFSEHPRAYELETLSSQQLEDSYSSLFIEGSEEVGKELDRMVITRPILISVTYRTYSHSLDDKTKVKEDTALVNEEAIINDLRTTTLANGTILDMIATEIRTFIAGDDTFLINEITMQSFYRIST